MAFSDKVKEAMIHTNDSLLKSMREAWVANEDLVDACADGGLQLTTWQEIAEDVLDEQAQEPNPAARKPIFKKKAAANLKGKEATKVTHQKQKKREKEPSSDSAIDRAHENYLNQAIGEWEHSQWGESSAEEPQKEKKRRRPAKEEDVVSSELLEEEEAAPPKKKMKKK